MKIKYSDIELAYEFVSAEKPFMHTAILSKSEGKIYYHSEMGDNFEEMPENIYGNDDYIEVPHKNDLDLGKRLVWRFVEKEIPGLKDKIRGFFSRKGAYSRYKAFLEQIGLLETWYEFESSETQKALREWCEENEIEIDD